VLNAIFDGDVGVAGDNLAEAYLSEVAGRNEVLLGFNAKFKKIVLWHHNVLRRLSSSMKDFDDVGNSSPKKASLMVRHYLKQTFPGGCHFFH